MSEFEPNVNCKRLSPEQVDSVRLHLSQVIESSIFAGSERCKEFLKLVVAHALAEEWDDLRERSIGAELFGRPIDYDTANDAIVRVQATEVRRRLTRYYSQNTDSLDLRIVLPSGSYVPRFEWQSNADPAADAPVEISVSPPPAMILVGETASNFARAPGSLSSLRRWGIPIVFSFAAAAMYFLLARRQASRIPFQAIHSIAILPLADISGNATQDYLADGMTEELTADLGEVSSLAVVSKTSSMTYKGTKKTLPMIAHELGVEAVVTGSVEREGDRVRISAQLVDAKSDRYIWSHTYMRDLRSVLSMQTEVAQAIADAVRAKVTFQEQARLTRIRTIDPVAQEQYLIAIHLLTISDPMAAIDYLKRAISIDPTSAQAHAALASTYGWVGDAGWMPYSIAFNLEKTEAQKAIQLEDDLPDGHAALANAVMNLDWNWAVQDSELKKALSLNPSLASVRWPYASYLARVGRLDDASAEAQLAIRLDPVSSRAYTSSAFIYYFARQYDEALGQLQKANTLAHKSDELIYPSAVVHVEQGRFIEAIAEFEQLGNATHALGHLGNAYARNGETAKAEELIKTLQKQVTEKNIGRYEIALVYSGLGDRQRAFAALEEALVSRDKGMTFLKIDPCLDPLRTDVRFKDLERRVGLLEAH